MSVVDPTQPPAPVQPQLSPEELLAAFWQAKQARDWWQEEEKRLRFLLADAYAANENGGYSSKTLDVGGGMKLEFSVTRTLKVDTRNAVYLEWHKNATPEQLNKLFKTVPSKLEPSMSGYNGLTEDVKAAIAPAITFGETLSASFKQSKDER